MADSSLYAHRGSGASWPASSSFSAESLRHRTCGSACILYLICRQLTASCVSSRILAILAAGTFPEPQKQKALLKIDSDQQTLQAAGHAHGRQLPVPCSAEPCVTLPSRIVGRKTALQNWEVVAAPITSNTYAHATARRGRKDSAQQVLPRLVSLVQKAVL